MGLDTPRGGNKVISLQSRQVLSDDEVRARASDGIDPELASARIKTLQAYLTALDHTTVLRTSAPGTGDHTGKDLLDAVDLNQVDVASATFVSAPLLDRVFRDLIMERLRVLQVSLTAEQAQALSNYIQRTNWKGSLMGGKSLLQPIDPSLSQEVQRTIQEIKDRQHTLLVEVLPAAVVQFVDRLSDKVKKHVTPELRAQLSADRTQAQEQTEKEADALGARAFFDQTQKLHSILSELDGPQPVRNLGEQRQKKQVQAAADVYNEDGYLGLRSSANPAAQMVGQLEKNKRDAIQAAGTDAWIHGLSTFLTPIVSQSTLE